MKQRKPEWIEEFDHAMRRVFWKTQNKTGWSLAEIKKSGRKVISQTLASYAERVKKEVVGIGEKKDSEWLTTYFYPKSRFTAGSAINKRIREQHQQLKKLNEEYGIK